MTEETPKLKAGDRHPRAYVGPPGQYDFMGATQFRLLTQIGLREDHTVLDFGCGSLRAGRLLLPYLLPGNYFGIEPNKWLVDESISKELGPEFISMRRPSFDYNDRFDLSVFGRRFDYIVMQSILSHTGADLIDLALRNAAAAMHDASSLVVTVIHEEKATDTLLPGRDSTGWIYPQCVWYSRAEFRDMAQQHGYFSQMLPWYHPRQTWWLLTRSADVLLTDGQVAALEGAVFRDKRFAQAPRAKTSGPA